MTTEVSKEEKPETFNKSKNVAKRGGKVAGNVRKETEKELGRSVISNKNYIENNDLPQVCAFRTSLMTII